MNISRFPSVSTPDSVDWKEPTPEEIKNKVLKGVKSGSILLFHNDLENTTEALPQILTQLKSEGYEFVPVSELIYWDNYSIDSAGKQIPDLQSSINLTPEKLEEVLAEYSEEIAAVGLSGEQIYRAAEALKGGVEIPADIAAEIPEDLREVIAKVSVDGVLPMALTQEADDPADNGTSGDTSDPETPANPDDPEETDKDIGDVTFETSENADNNGNVDNVTLPPTNVAGAVTEK